MILANFITIVKYGVNIFLAVMGFISFDDINQKPNHTIDQNHSLIENVNYVEAPQDGEFTFSEKLCYASFNYSIPEKGQQEALFAKQSDYLIEEDFPEFNIHFREILADSEKFFILENESIKDFEVLVLQESENLEFEYCIRIVEENGVNIISNTLKNISFISFPHSID